jgi:hypothetical protein
MQHVEGASDGGEAAPGPEEVVGLTAVDHPQLEIGLVPAVQPVAPAAQPHDDVPVHGAIAERDLAGPSFPRRDDFLVFLGDAAAR